MPSPAPAPPPWLLVSSDVICVTSCTLLVLYLLNRLECNKFVRVSLALQALLLFLALVAYRTST